MALTGTKECTICGKEFKGLGNICKDGDYCNECEKKVRLVFAEDEEDYLPATNDSCQAERICRRYRCL